MKTLIKVQKLAILSFAWVSTLAFANAQSPSHDDARHFANRAHDPSTIIWEGKTAWVFSTGVGLKSQSSKDLKTWTPGPQVFTEPLPWLKDVAPSQRGHLWAPDILKIGDQFFLYYSVSAFGKQTSALALATNSTLDPVDKNYKWTDHGIVLRSKPGDPYNAIDPAILQDGERLWMSFGSFWEGLFLTELNPLTGKLKDPQSAPTQLACAPEIEAPFICKHGQYYYLFVNWGLCCRGIKSTYEIRVGRSEKIAGPYLDREGMDMKDGGGTLLLGTEGDLIGPGHASITHNSEGQECLAYHYYDAARHGVSFLALKPLHWTKSGWPELQSLIAPEAR